MVAGCRRYQRECGACGENYYLSGARTKHHLGSVRWRCSRLCRIRASRQAVSPRMPYRLLSHAESNYAGCCATFGSAGSLKDCRAFLADGRDKHFAIVARDSISGSLDVAHSPCLPRLAFRTWRSRRTGRSRLAPLASHTLWACRPLLTGTSLRTGWSWWSRRTLPTGRPLRAGGALGTGRGGRGLGALPTPLLTPGREGDNTAPTPPPRAPQKTQ